jgi:hypothetical protein
MPAPYRDKNILEMSDREREARRLAELERPGRDAVEGVYPEEVLIPAARGLRGLMTPRQPTRLEALYNQPMPKEALDAQKQFPPEMFELARKYMQKELRNKEKAHEAFTKYIREKNAPVFREQMRQRKLEAPRKDAERALTDVITKAEYYNIFGQPEQEYKRGGVVKAKTHRGDGIAQRGKTKGRYV